MSQLLIAAVILSPLSTVMLAACMIVSKWADESAEDVE